MSYDFEAIKLNGFVFSNTGLLFGNADLLSNRVHAFEIRQEQAAAASFFNDDAVNFWIEFVFRRDLFSRFQDINLVNKIFQLFRLDRREAAVEVMGGKRLFIRTKSIGIPLFWMALCRKRM